MTSGAGAGTVFLPTSLPPWPEVDAVVAAGQQVGVQQQPDAFVHPLGEAVQGGQVRHLTRDGAPVRDATGGGLDSRVRLGTAADVFLDDPPLCVPADAIVEGPVPPATFPPHAAGRPCTTLPLGH